MKQVRCIETDTVYPSATAAAQAHNITVGMIVHVLKGRQATAAGHTWEYTGKKSLPQSRYTGVYRDTNDRIYTSLREFAQRHGYTIRQVQNAIVKTVAKRVITLAPRSKDLFTPIVATKRHSRQVATPTPPAPYTVSEDQYWEIITPAIDTYKKRGERLTREQHEARVLIRNTWITAHPPTMPEFEGTSDRWRPLGVEEYTT